jgi:phage regulator Rha-like protein
MGQIEISTINETLVVDSRLIAEELGIEHKAFIRTIRKYLDEFEEMGVLSFKGDKPLEGSRGGRPETFCFLNEEQATYAMTLSRNSNKVRQCKRNLVKAFSEAKKIIQSVIPEQQNVIQELSLRLALANAEKDKAIAEKNLLDTRHYIATALPEPIQQKVLGYQLVKEVEKIPVVIDKSTGEEFDGVGITYIAKTLGFKNNQQCWAWLEKKGFGKDSEKWHNELTAINSQKLPREDLEYLKDIFKEEKHRQLWLGE